MNTVDTILKKETPCTVFSVEVQVNKISKKKTIKYDSTSCFYPQKLIKVNFFISKLTYNYFSIFSTKKIRYNL